MASKNETRAAIAALAAELGATTPDLDAIDKLEPLEALLDELRAAKLARDGATTAISIAPRFVVAEGMSVTTLRGQVDGPGTKRASEHCEVSPLDFAGGEAQLDDLVSAGFVVRVP